MKPPVAPWCALVFQATGPGFRPGRMGLAFSHAFEPGDVATFGDRQGQKVDFGAALYPVPDDPAAGPRDSGLASALTHLASLLPVFRAAGAEDFVLHMHRIFKDQCNEELTRKELQLLAALGCHLFFTARERA
jgi:hypothetical protein